MSPSVDYENDIFDIFNNVNLSIAASTQLDVILIIDSYSII